jgi:hypothetical protein
MTMNKPFSNAVFTLLPPHKVPDPLVDNKPDPEEEDDNKEHYHSYKKAVAGSYDKSYFVDETTGLFCFPRYNKDLQCLVSIRDLTPYKNQYFAYLGPKQRKAFTIDDFEAKFIYSAWDVQDFSDFLENLPEACFNKGVSRKEVVSLFDNFENFISDGMPAEDYFETDLECTASLQAGLVALADKNAIKPGKLWADHISPDKVIEICKANGIKPAQRNSANIKKLVDKKIPFPLEGVRPTRLLKDCYDSFIDLYIEEIKRSTNHFHPLLFKHLWDEVRRECINEDVQKRLKPVLAPPYWKDRLYKVGEVDDEEEDEFDFYDDDDDDE